VRLCILLASPTPLNHGVFLVIVNRYTSTLAPVEVCPPYGEALISPTTVALPADMDNRTVMVGVWGMLL
jgi:hypothetical protein